MKYIYKNSSIHVDVEVKKYITNQKVQIRRFKSNYRIRFGLAVLSKLRDDDVNEKFNYRKSGILILYDSLMMMVVSGIILVGFDRNTNKKTKPKRLIQAYKK